MPRGQRVDYDAIAHLYDAQPYRERNVDRELLAFAERRALAGLAVLDVGCGTGNQLIANHNALAQAWCVGLDRSFGMLRQARRKAAHIVWVHGDGAALPFAAHSFDFVYNHFAFHHIENKTSMLQSVFRVLRPGGGFTLHNMCPQKSQDWLYYKYFPEVRVVDLRDFWLPETVTESMKEIGFIDVEATYRHLYWEEEMAAWFDVVRRRDTCSQLQAISDAAYDEGVNRLERDIADPNIPRSRPNHLCLVTIRGEAPNCLSWAKKKRLLASPTRKGVVSNNTIK